MTAIPFLTRLGLVLMVTLTFYSPVEAAERPLKLVVNISEPLDQEIAACSFEPKLSTMVTVESLRLYSSKADSKKTDLQMLASIDRWNPTPRLFGGRNFGVGDFRGTFGFEGDRSELIIHWKFLWKSPVHRFRCSAEGLDHDGQRVTVSELVELTRSEPRVEQVCTVTNLDLLVNKFDDFAKVSTYAATALEDGMGRIEQRINTSIENRKKELETVEKTIQDIAQYIQVKSQEQETTAQNVETMISLVRSTQKTIERLENALAAQASAMSALQARFFYDVSSKYNGKYYLVSKAMNFEVDHSDTACVEYGGYLAELNDEQEFKFVMEFVKRLGSHVYYAVGVNNIDDKNNYVFYHSKEEASHIPWAKWEPNNLAGSEDCAALAPSKGGYVDISCSFKTKYICEV